MPTTSATSCGNVRKMRDLTATKMWADVLCNVALNIASIMGLGVIKSIPFNMSDATVKSRIGLAHTKAALEDS